MRALSRFVGMFAFLLALPAFVAMLSASCGKSDLVKAYESYDAVVDPLLARDIPLWGKLVTQFNEQLREETADLEKFGARVRDEAVPFYSELPAKVAALAPSNRDLARAHEWLVKYAASRAAFVRFLAANLDVLDPGASMESLSRRQNAAQQVSRTTRTRSRARSCWTRVLAC